MEIRSIRYELTHSLDGHAHVNRITTHEDGTTQTDFGVPVEEVVKEANLCQEWKGYTDYFRKVAEISHFLPIAVLTQYFRNAVSEMEKVIHYLQLMDISGVQDVPEPFKMKVPGTKTASDIICNELDVQSVAVKAADPTGQIFFGFEVGDEYGYHESSRHHGAYAET